MHRPHKVFYAGSNPVITTKKALYYIGYYPWLSTRGTEFDSPQGRQNKLFILRSTNGEVNSLSSCRDGIMPHTEYPLEILSRLKSECIVSPVDGSPWKGEDVGAKPTTQTKEEASGSNK